MEINLNAIGIIHTPFFDQENTPIQSARSDAPGVFEVLFKYMDGLEGIEDFSHIILLYAFNRSPALTTLKVKPFLDDRHHGVFVTRYPVRPNALGLSVVRVVDRQENRVNFLGADMLDGTPLLDIKPYIPETGAKERVKLGWLKAVLPELEADRRGGVLKD